MKIQRISQLGAAGMGALFVLAIGIGTYDVNHIRIGGTLHAHEQAAAGLLADSTPPSATAAAPYLVATRVVQGNMSASEAERYFSENRRAFEERQSELQKEDLLPQDIHDLYEREIMPSSVRTLARCRKLTESPRCNSRSRPSLRPKTLTQRASIHHSSESENSR